MTPHTCTTTATTVDGPIQFDDEHGNTTRLYIKVLATGSPSWVASGPASEEHVRACGFTPTAEAARVLNDLQQAHEAQLAAERKVHDGQERNLHIELKAEREAHERELSALRAQRDAWEGHAKRFEEELKETRSMVEDHDACELVLQAQLRDLTAEADHLRTAAHMFRRIRAGLTTDDHQEAEWFRLDALRSKPSAAGICKALVDDAFCGKPSVGRELCAQHTVEDDREWPKPSADSNGKEDSSPASAPRSAEDGCRSTVAPRVEETGLLRAERSALLELERGCHYYLAKLDALRKSATGEVIKPTPDGGGT